MKRGTSLNTEKKFFSKKVSKYQSILFSRLELADKQTYSAFEDKLKVSGKYQESIRKVSASVILQQKKIPDYVSGTAFLPVRG